MANRLDSISPELSRLFSLGNFDKQFAAVLVACSQAINENGLENPEVFSAISLLRVGRGDVSLKASLNSLSDRFDDSYFKLSNEDGLPKPESIPFFRKARATSALAFAIARDADELPEALYEAISAVEDRNTIIAAVEDALV